MISLFDWLQIQDPLVQRLVIAAAAFILLIIVLRILGRRREIAAARRRRAELQRSYESVRLQQEEIHRLAQQIKATSSTSRIAGFNIMRQIETVFSEGRPSSTSAVEMAKALAVQKGGNAIINLQTHQTANGKWVAGGDAVVVRVIGRRDGGEKKPEAR